MRPHQKLQKAIFEQISNLPNISSLKILDISCGDAEVLSRLAALGCDCTGTRFKQGDYIIMNKEVHESVKIIDGINLTEKLPFADSSFDVIVIQEVIEHLPNHSFVISEIGRVLKSDGFLVLSTPNIHRLHSRLHFFLTGAHKLKRRRIGWELKPDDLYAYHFNPVDFPVLHTFLYQGGVKVQRLVTTSVKSKYLPLWLLYPLIRVFSFFEFRVGQGRASCSVEGERELKTWMLSPEILFSEQLLLVGKKSSV